MAFTTKKHYVTVETEDGRVLKRHQYPVHNENEYIAILTELCEFASRWAFVYQCECSVWDSHQPEHSVYKATLGWHEYND